MTARSPSRSTALAVSSIRIGPRLRQDLGDIEALKASIAELGLLQPLVVDAKGHLLAGLRRLRAVEALGWTEVPVIVVKEIPHA